MLVLSSLCVAASTRLVHSPTSSFVPALTCSRPEAYLHTTCTASLPSLTSCRLPFMHLCTLSVSKYTIHLIVFFFSHSIALFLQLTYNFLPFFTLPNSPYLRLLCTLFLSLSLPTSPFRRMFSLRSSFTVFYSAFSTKVLSHTLHGSFEFNNASKRLEFRPL